MERWLEHRFSGEAAMTKSLLDKIKSPAMDVCECCHEPTYDPAHDLARRIFELLPPIPSLDAQKTYDEAVELIEGYFGIILELAETADEEPAGLVN
jgi:hypothetical protein